VVDDPVVSHARKDHRVKWGVLFQLAIEKQVTWTG